MGLGGLGDGVVYLGEVGVEVREVLVGCEGKGEVVLVGVGGR